ncbi:hypothetical protein TNCT_397851 [Trichonephila clavata]|uniref:Uncharacterized protein n=1 Tax=Trichonephila clavata TaxID=2740835 RepID=A0A8X6HZJ2_TRICU|nr:hypothetical protein TNCT_397851 [Trichonephila clavata]
MCDLVFTKIVQFGLYLGIPCQRSKVLRHMVAPLQKVSDTSTRFDDVHENLVKPLPPSQRSTIYIVHDHNSVLKQMNRSHTSS